MLVLGMLCPKAPWLAMYSLLLASALTRLSIVGRHAFCAEQAVIQTPEPCFPADQGEQCSARSFPGDRSRDSKNL